VTIAAATRSANWWGLASTIGLFLWFLFWFGGEPSTIIGRVLLWGPLASIHWFGFQAARQRFGWVYLVPLGIFWILIIIGLCGGIQTR